MGRFSLVLAIVLYILIYSLRLQQEGGFEGGRVAKAEGGELFINLRQDLDKTIGMFLPSPQAELLSGILLGNNKDLPPNLKLALRDTSTIHMVVVSGQNLTMVAGLFMLTLPGLVKRKTAILISFGAILFYTLLTGAQIPVVRAAIMASLGFGAEIFGRLKGGVWFLVVTCAAMLFYEPTWLISLSFQLSFLATLGVIVVAPILHSRLKFLPNFISQDLAVTIGAQALVLPVIAQNFHQVSLVGVFANLLVSWTVPFIMIIGTLMVVFGTVSILLGQVISWAVDALLMYFIYIVQFFASLPFAWEYVGEKVWVVWAGYYCLLAGVLIALNKKKLDVRD